MRRVRLGFVLIAIIALPAIGVTQWLRYPTADVPRKADGSPNLTAPAPRLADGKPDFSGLWHVAQRNPCNVSRLSSCAEIGGSPLARNIGASLPGGLPFQPWAAEITRQRTADDSRDDPHVRCLPDNPPRHWGLPHLNKLVHTPKLLVVLYEVNAMYRQIFIDGRPLPEDPTPGWMGYSTARWDGDTLVIQTSGLSRQPVDGPGRHPDERRREDDRAHSAAELRHARNRDHRRRPKGLHEAVDGQDGSEH